MTIYRQFCYSSLRFLIAAVLVAAPAWADNSCKMGTLNPGLSAPVKAACVAEAGARCEANNHFSNLLKFVPQDIRQKCMSQAGFSETGCNSTPGFSTDSKFNTELMGYGAPRSAVNCMLSACGVSNPDVLKGSYCGYRNLKFAAGDGPCGGELVKKTIGVWGSSYVAAAAKEYQSNKAQESSDPNAINMCFTIGSSERTCTAVAPFAKAAHKNDPSSPYIVPQAKKADYFSGTCPGNDDPKTAGGFASGDTVSPSIGTGAAPASGSAETSAGGLGGSDPTAIGTSNTTQGNGTSATDGSSTSSKTGAYGGVIGGKSPTLDAYNRAVDTDEFKQYVPISPSTCALENDIRKGTAQREKQGVGTCPSTSDLAKGLKALKCTPGFNTGPADEATILADIASCVPPNAKVKAPLTPMRESELQEFAITRLLDVITKSIARQEGLSNIMSGDRLYAKLNKLKTVCTGSTFNKQINATINAVMKDVEAKGGKMAKPIDTAAWLQGGDMVDAVTSGDAEIGPNANTGFKVRYIDNLTKAATSYEKLTSESRELLWDFDTKYVMKELPLHVASIPCVNGINLAFNLIAAGFHQDEQRTRQCALHRNGTDCEEPRNYEIFHRQLKEDDKFLQANECIRKCKLAKQKATEMAVIMAEFPELSQKVDKDLDDKFYAPGNLSLYLSGIATQRKQYAEGGKWMDGPPEDKGPKIDKAIQSALDDLGAQGNALDGAVAAAADICRSPAKVAKVAFTDPRLSQLIFDCKKGSGVSDETCARLRLDSTISNACKMQEEALQPGFLEKLEADGVKFAREGLPHILDGAGCLSAAATVYRGLAAAGGAVAGSMVAEAGAAADFAASAEILTVGTRFKEAAKSSLSFVAKYGAEPIKGTIVGSFIGGAMFGAEYMIGDQAARDAAMRWATGSGNPNDQQIVLERSKLTLVDAAADVIYGAFVGALTDHAISKTFPHILDDYRTGKFDEVMSGLADGTLNKDSIRVQNMRVEMMQPLYESGFFSADTLAAFSNETLFGLYKGMFENAPFPNQLTAGGAAMKKNIDGNPNLSKYKDLPATVSSLERTRTIDPLDPTYKAAYEKASAPNATVADVDAYASLVSDARARKALGNVEAAKMVTDNAVLRLASRDYLDATRQRMSWDASVETKAKTDHPKHFEGLDAKQQHEMALLVRAVEDAGGVAGDVDTAAAKWKKQLCSACGICTK